MSVLHGLRESMRLPDLRRRILITLFLLVIYRFAANVPVPGVDRETLSAVLDPNTGVGNFAQILDLLSGGAVSNFSVLAMGVYPYITASIILQILTPIIPHLEELQKEGKSGQDQINRYTYYLAIPMSVLNAIGQLQLFRHPTTGASIITGFGFTPNDDLLLTATVLSIMAAGTMFAIWLGELITEDGIGNGLSMIIFAGILARVPTNLVGMFSTDSAILIRNVLIFTAITLLTVVVIVIVQEGQRRIPVKYGKRVRGTKMYGGGSTYVPLRVNTAGMIPLIFASTILSFPGILASLFSQSDSIFIQNLSVSMTSFFAQQGGAVIGSQIGYWSLYFFMVVGFTYLYTDILIRNQNLAQNLQRNGGFIPGVRPGKRTEEFITKVYQRITLVGALFLGLVAVLPGAVQVIMEILDPGSGASIRSALLIVQGGSLIIVVGVIIDTLRQLEAQLVMRNRESFIR